MDHPMESHTAEKVKDLWAIWDIRVCILLSLFIQAFLTIVAPFRKSSANTIISILIWALYLSAEAVAVFVIGLIAKNEADSPEKMEVLAFWAPFLLLHLGGPDAITALALEDNELWQRHALQLATQLIITIYVFIKSLQHKGLLAPTLLMLFDGLWKYIERTWALFVASANNFRDSLVGKPETGPNYARLMEEYVSAKDAHIPVHFQGKDGHRPSAGSSQSIATYDLNNDEDYSNVDNEFGNGAEAEEIMVRKANYFFDLFKPLLADGFLSLKNREISRNFFVHSKNGFRIIEIELNLIYDTFYTKSFLLWRKSASVRPFCFIAAIVSLVLFFFKDRSIYHKSDVILTFLLLGGAIALDICAVLMFVRSDWFIIFSNIDGQYKCFKSFMLRALKYSRWARQPDRKRWSKSISKYNLLKRCFRKPPFFISWFSSIRQIQDALLGWLYVEQEIVYVDDIIEHVKKELNFKARQADKAEVAKEVCSARGNFTLHDDYFLVSECLSPWTIDIDYDESLLIWHLATDMCYWTSMEGSSTAETSTENTKATKREISKALSDYMSYLLLRKQTMLSSLVGMSETRFEDTCAEARKFMKYETVNVSWFILKIFCCIGKSNLHKSENKENIFFKKVTEDVLKINSDVPPITAKGDKSKSMLFDACRLAKQLVMFDDEHQWEIISKVWVELLCYAAVRCTPRSHIAQLSKGGELITLVWLYMTHLGLGERFLQNQGFGWTKLIVDK